MYQLDSDTGLIATFDPFGATISQVYLNSTLIGDKGGVKGRCANRIAGSEFVLDGHTYRLPANDGRNHLHGGPGGFSKLTWNVENFDQPQHTITFALDSADGDMGYPGNLHTTVTYTLVNNDLSVEFRALSDADTIFNPVNHLYLNMNGTDSTANHKLQIAASSYTPADGELIPTGEILPVEGTRYDYRTARIFDGAAKGEYDINLVLDGNDLGLREAAHLTGQETGWSCTVLTDQPGLQLYNTESRICLEAQHFPDAVHHSNFPSVILRANTPYYSKTVYRFES